MPYPTLTARWSNIAIVTWAVPPAAVAGFLPAHGSSAWGGRSVELDAAPRKGLLLPDGKPGAALSMVAMQCSHARIYGFKWPGIARYTTLALRLCVKQSGGSGSAKGGGGVTDQRGFVYIREIVSSKPIAWLLRTRWNQPCIPGAIRAEVKQQTRLIGAEYRVLWPIAGAPIPRPPAPPPMAEHMLRVVGAKPPAHPTTDDALESWLTDRPFVFGLDKAGRARVHEVIHPVWGVHETVSAELRFDFGVLFGPELAFLGGLRPAHSMLATGSEAAMFPAGGSTAAVRWAVRRGRR